VAGKPGQRNAAGEDRLWKIMFPGLSEVSVKAIAALNEKNTTRSECGVIEVFYLIDI
jgi:hypothetical protein